MKLYSDRDRPRLGDGCVLLCTRAGLRVLQIPEENVGNFTSNWRDGRRLFALIEALRPGAYALSPTHPRQFRSSYASMYARADVLAWRQPAGCAPFRSDSIVTN